MIAPALVDGRPLSHPDHDRIWSAFVEHGVTPVFHVADQPRVFDDAWFTDPSDQFVSVLDSVFLWTPPAVAVADLIVNGVLDRHPDLRIGVIELSAVWVPLFLMMLDGAWDFTARLNGRTPRRPVAAAERVRHAAGPGRGVLLRAAGPARRAVRRPLHGLQRLPALRGHRRPGRRLPGRRLRS